MGKHLILICACCLALFACSDEETLNIIPEAEGTFTDERDGEVYGWIRIGNLEWMTENLRFGTPYPNKEYSGAFSDQDGYPQGISQSDGIDLEADFKENGNLYDWYEADTLCPTGWRLPTDDDWKDLERQLNMSNDEVNAEGWRGDGIAHILRQGEEGLGLGLQLSGCAWQSGAWDKYIHLNGIGESGYFWTATPNGTDKYGNPTVYIRRITGTQNSIFRGLASLNILMRVRCVRDAQN